MKIKANKILAVLCVIAMLMTMIVPMTLTAAAEGTWTLVKDVAELAVGDQIVIAAKNANFAISTTQKTNNRAQAAVTKSGDTLTFGNDVQILTLENGTKSGTFAFNTGSGYLYAASSSKNYLKTQAKNNDNGSWKIEISTNGTATIKAQGTNTRNWLRYNADQKNGLLFSCYASGQTDVVIYKLVKDNAAPSISVTGENTLQIGDVVTLNAELANIEGDVAWTSSDTSVATVADGVVTANAMGKTTITATADGASDDIEITVFPAGPELTIAEALEVCELTGTTDAPYVYSVTGTIKSIDTAYNSQYDNITVTITDGTDSIPVYRMKGGETLREGDKISVAGTLVNFGGNTPEFTTGATYELIADDDVDTIRASLDAIEAYMQLSYTYTETNTEEDVLATTKVVDTLTRATTGATGSSYVNWNGKTLTSSAVYAGRNAGSNSSIQLNTGSDNDRGIITTTSGGKARKITVEWETSTTAGRTLNVYGSHTPYTATTDLYNATAQGVLLGTIVKGTSTDLVIEGDYEYIAFRSNGGALYLISVSIEWETPGGESTGETQLVTTYSDSQFVFNCGVDASIEDFANIEGVTAYGIAVTAGEKTVYYTENTEGLKSWTVADNKISVSIALGDIINDEAKLGTEFTVRAFVEVDGVKFTSAKTKTYSVKTIVEEYYEVLEITDVEPLYNILCA